MASYTAQIGWTAQPGEDFARGRYSRAYTMRFDGGATIAGSASPHEVGAWANEAGIDTEEMLVAALSACHMLTFLHRARLAGVEVATYDDAPAGTMAEIAAGRRAVTHVVLRPTIAFAGASPDAATLARLHEEAHATCFIANSVTTEVVVETT